MPDGLDSSLLREALARFRPDLLERLATLGQVPLTNDEREDLRAAVAQELLASGLADDDEPNERGYALEEVIDALGRL
jgi:hypothetical protein